MAHLVERRTQDPRVTSSNPVLRIITFFTLKAIFSFLRVIKALDNRNPQHCTESILPKSLSYHWQQILRFPAKDEWLPFFPFLFNIVLSGVLVPIAIFWLLFGKCKYIFLLDHVITINGFINWGPKQWCYSLIGLSINRFSIVLLRNTGNVEVDPKTKAAEAESFAQTDGSEGDHNWTVNYDVSSFTFSGCCIGWLPRWRVSGTKFGAIIFSPLWNRKYWFCFWFYKWWRIRS